MKVKLNSAFQREEADAALRNIGAFEAYSDEHQLKLGSTVLVLPDELVPDFERALVDMIMRYRANRQPTNATHSVLRNLHKAIGARS